MFKKKTNPNAKGHGHRSIGFMVSNNHRRVPNSVTMRHLWMAPWNTGLSPACNCCKKFNLRRSTKEGGSFMAWNVSETKSNRTNKSFRQGLNSVPSTKKTQHGVQICSGFEPLILERISVCRCLL